MTKRRYRDEEVREIFSLATAGDVREKSLSAETGGLGLPIGVSRVVPLPARRIAAYIWR